MSYTNGLDKPDLYFNTVTYSGNGSTGQSVTGVGFQPDFIWFKNRTTAGYFHELYDVIRGVRKPVYSNSTNSEGTTTASLESFDSDGFSVDSEDASGEGVNRNGDNYVAWNWLASNTTASNTDGSITSTVSANTTSGFSIVSYTGNGTGGATIGHGLATTPSCIIVKNRNTADNWLMYHESIGNTKVLYLNESFATGTSSAYWNNTSPTSSVFTVGTEVPMNKSGDSIIAYCFAEKKGFSKFGSYTGNGNSDGTFVYTGFKPAFVMTKSSSNSGASYNWQIWDNKRNTYNAVDTQLRPNTTEIDNTDISYSMDFTSQGFKMRGTNTNQNGSGSTYIYMCFAESPFTTSTGIPTTAR